MDVNAIRDRPLSQVLLHFYVCQECGIVDRDTERVRIGHPCSQCGALSKGSHSYFPVPVPVILDLMQDAFHRDSLPVSMRGAWVSKNTDSQLGTVVYFSTLGEVLFGNLLWEVMAALELTHGVADRLLDDNPYPKQRAEKLFPSLTATKWKVALQTASTTSGRDFVETFRFYLSVAEARNALLHEGNKWAVDPIMPSDCMKHIEPMLSLFLELHNQCVLAIYKNRGKSFRLAGT